ncbi:antitoxin VapB family protein [Candidatus Woesearchaeota archaeon]|nr:antitoxin VapB family protein [Candidatus Woesearchaeota archaeon]
MATKTLTITEDAYTILKNKKMKDESFSEEITRLLSNKRKKSLMDFFGILTNEEGEGMLKALEEKRKINIQLMKERYKHLL